MSTDKFGERGFRRRFRRDSIKHDERRKKKKEARPIFEAIRQPTAPPRQKFGSRKAAAKANHGRRQVKHRRAENVEDDSTD